MSWAVPALALALAVAAQEDPVVPGLPPEVVREARSGTIDRIEAARTRVREHPRDGAAWSELARTFQANHYYPQAVESYRHAVQLAPEDFAPAYLLAVSNDTGGVEPASAEALYRAALGLRPTYLPAHLRLGNLLARAGRSEDALRAYRAALVFDAHYAPAHLGVAQVLIAQGRAEEALPHLEDAAERFPDDRSVLAALARALMAAGRRDEAREVSERCRAAGATLDDRDTLLREVEELGSYAAAAQVRGQRALDAGRYEEAIEAFRLVLDQRPDTPQVLFQIGLAYVRTRRPREAERAWLRAVELAPEHVDARLALARLYAHGRPAKPTEAFVHVEAVLRADATNAEALVLGATIRAQEDRAAEALELFERAEAVGPLDARALVGLGGVLFRLARPADAEARFRAAIALDPELGLAHFNLGAVLAERGDVAGALAAYERAAELDPRLPTAERITALRER